MKLTREYGTKVKTPCHNANHPAYSQCSMCGKWYTKLGLSRHWEKCPKKTAEYIARQAKGQT